MTPADLEYHNANLIGGDITGGRQGLNNFFCARQPALPHAGQGLYLCSASTPPGGGVHGMCGYNAANCVLHDTA